MYADFLIENGIGQIALNRPDRLNAVSPEVVQDLCAALEQAIEKDVPALILSGRGRAFCSGHDLKYEPGDIDYAADRRNVERVQDITRLIRRAPFPIIAAVHGYALGAGCEIALCSDLVVAAENAIFGFPEVSVGLSITGGISHILPVAVGPVKAKELVLLGERFSAEQAYDLGLVNSVVPTDSLEKEALKLATTLAALPRQALRLAKVALDRGAQGDLSCALELETVHALQTRGSTEATRASLAFRKRQ